MCGRRGQLTEGSNEGSSNPADMGNVKTTAVRTQDRLVTKPSASGEPAELPVDTVVIPVNLCSLPPLNAVANQVLALSADPDLDLRELAGTMTRDPAFAADVLFLANSSLFGFPSRIRALSHAVAILGLERIKALAVTVAMRGFVGTGTPLVRQCWQHSVACAIIAEEIAPLMAITSEVAYTVALLHDVGRLGLLKSYPKESEAVLKTAFDSVDQVLEAERQVLHVDHGRAGGWLVGNWSFPESFKRVCEQHHDPCSAGDPELLLLIKAVCRMADSLGYAAVKYTAPVSYDEVLASLPPVFRLERFPREADLKADIESKVKIFG